MSMFRNCILSVVFSEGDVEKMCKNIGILAGYTAGTYIINHLGINDDYICMTSICLTTALCGKAIGITTGKAISYAVEAAKQVVAIPHLVQRALAYDDCACYAK